MYVVKKGKESVLINLHRTTWYPSFMGTDMVWVSESSRPSTVTLAVHACQGLITIVHRNLMCMLKLLDTIHVSIIIYMFLNERWEGRKKEASKVKQTNKAKQHSTPKAVTFPRKNELPQVGLEPTTLYTLDRALYQLSYRGSSAGWAHVHVTLHYWFVSYTLYFTYSSSLRPFLLPNICKKRLKVTHRNAIRTVQSWSFNTKKWLC